MLALRRSSLLFQYTGNTTRKIIFSKTRFTINQVRLLSSIQPNPVKKRVDFDTLVEMQIKSCETNENSYLFGTRGIDKFEWITYSQFEREVQKFRNVLAHLDFGHGDKVAVICNNRVEWATIAFAAAGRGGIVLYCIYIYNM